MEQIAAIENCQKHCEEEMVKKWAVETLVNATSPGVASLTWLHFSLRIADDRIANRGETKETTNLSTTDPIGDNLMCLAVAYKK